MEGTRRLHKAPLQPTASTFKNWQLGELAGLKEQPYDRRAGETEPDDISRDSLTPTLREDLRRAKEGLDNVNTARVHSLYFSEAGHSTNWW